jgi:PEP-CTERM motif
MRSQTGFLILCAALVAGTAARADTVIEPQGEFVPGTNLPQLTYVVGETIQAPTNGDTSLVSFGVGVEFPVVAQPEFIQGEVYAWDGSEATGPALYTSPLEPFVAEYPNLPNPIFETGGINLEAGGEYVIFVNVLVYYQGAYHPGDFYPDYLQPGTGPGYTGGSSVTTQSLDPSLWTTEAWSVGVPGAGDNDALPQIDFIATFAAPVPEPATWILLTAGFIGMAAASRLRRRRGAA